MFVSYLLVYLWSTPMTFIYLFITIVGCNWGPSEGGFKLGYKTKETPQSSDSIGQNQKIGPIEFALRCV